GDLDGRLGALRGFLEGDFEIVAKIGAALRAAGPAPEDVAEAEHAAQDVAEVAELAEDRRVEAAAGRSGTDAGVAEPVVAGAFVGVREHRIRLGRLLEAILGNAVSRIAIGVILHGEPAVRALDLTLVGGLRHA